VKAKTEILEMREETAVAAIASALQAHRVYFKIQN
jgi:hypothetical protein